MHDEGEAGKEHLFAFIPGIGPLTGFTRLLHLATDTSVLYTTDGFLGSFSGDYLDHYWRILDQDGERFLLQSRNGDAKLFSNGDGRLGCFPGEFYEDQLFCCEDEAGHTLRLDAERGSYGLQDTGFGWDGYMLDRTIFTDALHAGHYVVEDSSGQLGLLQEERTLPGIPQGGIGAPAWGSGADLRLAEMEQPHAWAIEHIPLLARLRDAGLISAEHPSNEAYETRDPATDQYAGNGLPPSGAIRFALQPVSAGRAVDYEPDWLLAWHGTGLHNIEGIARWGLQARIPFACNDSKIFLSPSFRYTFSLYSTLDLLVEKSRFRLVIEARVRPGSFSEHGDPYQFCSLPCVEPCIPEEQMEWELGSNEEDIQVVGLVLKQLCPYHPTLRHDSIQRHGRKSLMHL